MPSTFNLPPLENGASQATIERYFHAKGARIEQGQPLAVVVTNRFEWEIPTTATGAITEIVAQPGTVVAIGAPLLEIEVVSDAVAQPEQRQVIGEFRATPLARRIAATHGLSLADVPGSGRGGRITRSDVLDVLQIEPAGAAPSTNGRVSSVSTVATAGTAHTASTTHQSPLVAPIAAQEQERAPDASILQPGAQKHQAPTSVVPHALTAVEVDLTAVQRYVEAHEGRLAKRGIPLDANACVVFAAVGALGRHRLLNSAWHDDGIILWRRIDISWMGQTTPSTTPTIIANAADLSLQGLARGLSGQLQASPAINPTITIRAAATALWSEQFATPTHSGMLHIGTPLRRPHVVEEHGTDTITLRLLSILTLSYDARIADQHQADAFLIDIKQQLEHFDALC